MQTFLLVSGGAFLLPLIYYCVIFRFLTQNRSNWLKVHPCSITLADDRKCTTEKSANFINLIPYSISWTLYCYYVDALAGALSSKTLSRETVFNYLSISLSQLTSNSISPNSFIIFCANSFRNRTKNHGLAVSNFAVSSNISWNHCTMQLKHTVSINVLKLINAFSFNIYIYNFYSTTNAQWASFRRLSGHIIRVFKLVKSSIQVSNYNV